jgi:hypothetical protein
MPSSSSRATRRSIIHFSSLASGTPKRIRPPGASSRSNTVTRCPARFSSAGAAMPAGPEPTTATRRPLRSAGGRGVIQPSSKPRSAIAYSICLIITGSSLMSSTQADSHGAGQIRPVNSGKLLVASSWRMASSQRSWRTRSFQSGMRLPSGQPLLQNGTPQPMQRAAWSRSSGSGSVPKISPWSRTRSRGSRSGSATRWTRRKPRGSLTRLPAPALPRARPGAPRAHAGNRAA